jgi:CubicO group peptidase (beta-lactamase class C family)
MAAATVTATVSGTCDARFAPVREAFETSFARGEEIGASVAVVLDGKPVLSLFGGHADPAKTRPWKADTLVNVYSTTKGMAALCLHQLIEEGKVDLDAPVARYWPEFAAAGKGEVPVRFLLSHRVGLPAVRKLLPNEALYDWSAMTAALAAETPWWTPGERHGYHAVTFGWLVGEVVRRVTGKSVGTVFRERIAGPLGADFYIGLPEAEDARVAELGAMVTQPAPDSGGFNLMEAFMKDPEGMVARAFMNPPSMAFGPNNPAWRRAEIPAANGQANALGIAKVYGAVVAPKAGHAVLSAESVARASQEHSQGADAVLQLETRFGLGFMIPQARRDARFGPGERSFGHPGAGGSLGFADPEARIGFGYAMNKMGPSILMDVRPLALIDALYSCL